MIRLLQLIVLEDVIIINVKNLREISSNDEKQYVYACYVYEEGSCKEIGKYKL